MGLFSNTSLRWGEKKSLSIRILYSFPISMLEKTLYHNMNFPFLTSFMTVLCTLLSISSCRKVSRAWSVGFRVLLELEESTCKDSWVLWYMNEWDIIFCWMVHTTHYFCSVYNHYRTDLILSSSVVLLQFLVYWNSRCALLVLSEYPSIAKQIITPRQHKFS